MTRSTTKLSLSVERVGAEFQHQLLWALPHLTTFAMSLANLSLRAKPLRLSALSQTSVPRLRFVSTQTTAQESAPEPSSSSEPLTHFRITLKRSAISLPERIKGTLVSLGIHRRLQTVYHEHSSINAGKILRVKELVEVQNVPASAVRTKTEQRKERKAPRGYTVAGSRLHEDV